MALHGYYQSSQKTDHYALVDCCDTTAGPEFVLDRNIRKVEIRGMQTQKPLYVFSEGVLALTADKPPDWLVQAEALEAQEHDRVHALSSAGADRVETHGQMNETIDIWRFGGNQWAIDWWDIDTHLMTILVFGVIDFAIFQATWICPMVAKLLAVDAVLRVQAERHQQIQAGAPEDAAAVALH